jgi:hypothetical protein
MSVSSVGVAMGRIKVAHEQSMISIFKVYGSETSVNAVFHNTILTDSLIKAGKSSGYIGSYHRNMDMGRVLDEICEAIAG